MSFALVMNDGKGAGKCFSFTREQVSIGRMKDNDLVLFNTGVSRKHCVITMRSSEHYTIEDAGSSNGTIVNGERISGAVKLKDNDLVTIGPVTFQFRVGDTMPGQDNGGNEHYEETLDLNNGDLGIQSSRTQAFSAADVKRSMAAIKIAQEAQAQQAAAQQAAQPEAAAIKINAPTPVAPAAPKAESAPAEEAAPAGEGEQPKRKRVTGQRRGNGQTGAYEAAGAAEENPGKRVTGDPNRRARLAAEQKEKEKPKVEEPEPIKETTQKVQPRKPFKVWWAELPKQRKIIFGSLAGGVVLLLVLVIILGGGDSSLGDNSSKVFPLNQANSSKSYGMGKKVKVSCHDKVSFSFDYNGGLVVLRYSVRNIDSPNELAIYANNQLVGYAPITTKWLQDVQVKLPAAMLKPHSKNVVTFDSTMNPPGNDIWAVKQVTIQEKPLPEPDPERAMQFFSLAKEAYKSYLVDPANLSTAIGHYNDALILLEKLDPKPPLYGQIEVALKEAEDTLKRIYDDKIYQSYRAERGRDYEEARNILNELLRYLPNTEDPRRKEVLDRLKYLGQR